MMFLCLCTRVVRCVCGHVVSRLHIWRIAQHAERELWKLSESSTSVSGREVEVTCVHSAFVLQRFESFVA